MNEHPYPGHHLLRLTLLLQLESRARLAPAEELPYVMVNESSELFPYRQAVLWRRDPARLVAASGVASMDKNSPYALWLMPMLQAFYDDPRAELITAFDAGDLPGVNLTFGKVDVVSPGTKGRALDHIGFEVRNLAQFAATLEAAGVKLEAPIRKAGNGTTSIAFLTDPWGTYIELTEGLAP